MQQQSLTSSARIYFSLAWFTTYAKPLPIGALYWHMPDTFAKTFNLIMANTSWYFAQKHHTDFQQMMFICNGIYRLHVLKVNMKILLTLLILEKIISNSNLFEISFLFASSCLKNCWKIEFKCLSQSLNHHKRTNIIHLDTMLREWSKITGLECHTLSTSPDI